MKPAFIVGGGIVIVAGLVYLIRKRAAASGDAQTAAMFSAPYEGQAAPAFPYAPIGSEQQTNAAAAPPVYTPSATPAPQISYTLPTTQTATTSTGSGCAICDSVQNAISSLRTAGNTVSQGQQQVATAVPDNTNAGFVAQLYNAIGRGAGSALPADAQGSLYWQTELASGKSRTEVASNFLQAAASSTYSNSRDAELAAASQRAQQMAVTGLYASIGRTTPDAEGQAYWLGKLQSGQALADVQREFLSSAMTYSASNDPTLKAAADRAKALAGG